MNKQRRAALCVCFIADAPLSMRPNRRYLCAEEKQATNIKQKGECAVSTDFTKHYGHTVYVCQGAAVKDIHGDAWDPSSRT